MELDRPPLLSNDGLYIRQSVSESWSPLEEANSYAISTIKGESVLHATEHSHGLGSTLLRTIFKNRRPFTIDLTDLTGRTLYRFSRPFALLGSRLDVKDEQGRALGQVVQTLSWSKKTFALRGRGVGGITITGPRVLAHRFDIQRGAQRLGHIRNDDFGDGWLNDFAKGDANVFALIMERELDETARVLCLAATFLIDFLYFEDNHFSNVGRQLWRHRRPLSRIGM